MSADFWSSYASGALGICIGNRLDILKTELQAGNRTFVSSELLDNTQPSRYRALTSLLRGAAAPVVGYGALNSILFVTYNRTLKRLDPSIFNYNKLAGVDLGKIWTAGALGGLACWVVSAPSELIKCRTQLMVDGRKSSYAVATDVYKLYGLRGFYVGGSITSVRDSFGYAWYFWSYELSKRLLLSRQHDPFMDASAADVLIAGGIAGVATWFSIYPLDVIKTRIQTQDVLATKNQVLGQSMQDQSRRSWTIAKNIFRHEGFMGFYRGLAVCSFRAFIVNAVQFYVYESAMKVLNSP